MREIVDIFGVVVTVVAAFFAVVTASLVGYAKIVVEPACAEYGRISNQQTMFTVGTSCLVHRNGEWVDYEVAVGKKQEITVKSK